MWLKSAVGDFSMQRNELKELLVALMMVHAQRHVQVTGQIPDVFRSISSRNFAEAAERCVACLRVCGAADVTIFRRQGCDRFGYQVLLPTRFAVSIRE